MGASGYYVNVRNSQCVCVFYHVAGKLSKEKTPQLVTDQTSLCEPSHTSSIYGHGLVSRI